MLTFLLVFYIFHKTHDQMAKLKESIIELSNTNMGIASTMEKLAKSLGLKSVSQFIPGNGSLSYFLDDEKEAKKLSQFLQTDINLEVVFCHNFLFLGAIILL